VVLRRGDAFENSQGVFHPSGDWLAVTNLFHITLWAIRQPQPFVLRGHESPVWNVSFTNDSKWLISCGQLAAVRTWSLDPEVGIVRQIEGGVGSNCNALAVAPDGRQILLGNPGGARLVSSSEGETRVLMDRPPDGGIFGVAYDASGRRAALSTAYSPGPPKKIRIWDLESNALVRELPLAPPGDNEVGVDWGVGCLAFTPGGELLAAGNRGIRRFDIETGRSAWIWRLGRDLEGVGSMGLSQDGRRLLATALPSDPDAEADPVVVLFDLAEGTRQTIASHGNRVLAAALDPSGTIVVTGDEQGAVRVGPTDDGEPHLLLGHSEAVNYRGSSLAVSPDGRWIASAAGSEIRLWPMPDLSKPPLHTLPREELIAKLETLTNLRVVRDEESPTGWKVEVGPFPGWATVPEW
jgi:WD40 repeat protein